MEATAAPLTQADSTGLRYGILPVENWDLLQPIFELNEAILPDPKVATAAVAVDETGKIVGMLVCQLVYHAEPIWIEPVERGRVDFTKLVELIDALFIATNKPAEYYAFGHDDLIVEMAKKVGMKEVPWKILRKSF